MSKEQVFVTVCKEYLMELEQKAKDSEYFRGRVNGMEYVVDALQEALKGEGEPMSRWTTIEEKIKLLDAIKVCIEEHPIVGQWITEILDRKTEPNCSEIPTDCDTCRYAGECDWEPWQECPYEPKTEPQTERSE